MRFGSPKGRRHRAKGWRRRKYGFGEVRHRRWFKGAPGRWRKIAAKVEVTRIGFTGEGGPSKPYRAIACVGTQRALPRRTPGAGPRLRHDATPRLAAHRCGEGRGKTPTRAIKRALADLARSFK